MLIRIRVAFLFFFLIPRHTSMTDELIGTWDASVTLDDDDGLHMAVTLDGITTYAGLINLRIVGIMGFHQSGRLTIGFAPMATITLAGYFGAELGPILRKKLEEAIPPNRFWWVIQSFVNDCSVNGWVAFFWDNVNNISVNGTRTLVQCHMLNPEEGLIIENPSREKAILCAQRIMACRRACKRPDQLALQCDCCLETSTASGRAFRLPSEEKGGWTTHKICDRCMHGVIMDAAWKHKAWSSAEAKKRLRVELSPDDDPSDVKKSK